MQHEYTMQHYTSLAAMPRYFAHCRLDQAQSALCVLRVDHGIYKMVSNCNEGTSNPICVSQVTRVCAGLAKFRRLPDHLEEGSDETYMLYPEDQQA